MTKQPEPTLFISYSWSSPDHEAWVVEFAEELVSQAIHVKLDKWDLQPGHDANAFMEGMVTDPAVTKVVLVCDRKYVQKSDARLGGAGTEAQIITPRLYAKKAQDKFVAVIRERDPEGKPFLPAYYGSRIYIDLTNPSTYSTEFDRLVRWAWDQPLYVRPEMGKKPSLLTASRPSKIATGVAFRRAFDSIRSSAPTAVAATSEYFSIVASGLDAFRVRRDAESGKEIDDVIVNSIDEFLPYRNEIIEIVSAIAQYCCTEDMLRVVHRFLEQLLPYTERPAQLHSWNEAEFDNFRFIAHEVFLYVLAVFLRFEKFDAFSYVVANEFFWESPDNPKDNMHSFLKFRTPTRSLGYRNDRLKLGKLSLRAAILNKRNEGTGLDFRFVMTADLILYFRSRTSDIWHMWWPETLLYAGRYGGAFELFARAKSVRHFDRIKSMLGVASKKELDTAIQKILNEPDRIPKWQFESFDIKRLMGVELLATIP